VKKSTLKIAVLTCVAYSTQAQAMFDLMALLWFIEPFSERPSKFFAIISKCADISISYKVTQLEKYILQLLWQ